MLKVKSAPLELRGVATKVSGKGKMYYTLNVETDDGSPHQLYCPNVDALPAGLKKGDMIFVTFDVAKYQNNERLVVIGVERAE